MYLSDRDIRWAIQRPTLVIPDGSKVDPTSIDLKLDCGYEIGRACWDAFGPATAATAPSD